MSALILRYNGRCEYVIYRPKQRQAVFLTPQEINRLDAALRVQNLSDPFALNLGAPGGPDEHAEFHRRVFYSEGKRVPYVGDQLELGLYDCRQPYIHRDKA